jgi:hypothetical protein
VSRSAVGDSTPTAVGVSMTNTSTAYAGAMKRLLHE